MYILPNHCYILHTTRTYSRFRQILHTTYKTQVVVTTTTCRKHLSYIYIVNEEHQLKSVRNCKLEEFEILENLLIEE